MEQGREGETARAARGEIKRVVMKRNGTGEELGGASTIYRRIGNELIGETIEEKVVTADNAVVKSEEVKAICSVCGKPTEERRYSIYSERSLCRLCSREFTMSNGEKGFVSESEKLELEKAYDTWEAFDEARKRGRNNG